MIPNFSQARDYHWVAPEKVADIRRRGSWLALLSVLSAIVLGLAAFVVVMFGSQNKALNPALVFAGLVPFFALLMSAGSLTGARRCVSTGYLQWRDARKVRTGLTMHAVLTLVGAVIACSAGAFGGGLVLAVFLPMDLVAIVLSGLNFVTARRWLRADPVPGPNTGY